MKLDWLKRFIITVQDEMRRGYEVRQSQKNATRRASTNPSWNMAAASLKMTDTYLSRVPVGNEYGVRDTIVLRNRLVCNRSLLE